MKAIYPQIASASLRYNALKRLVLAFDLLLVALILIIFGAASCAFAQQKGRIINGTPTSVPWPWMVSLSYQGIDAAHGHFCGGTLIDSKFVLTAAHCVYDSQNTPDAILAVIGRSRLTDTDGAIIPADGVIIHPNYNPETTQNDIALVRLSVAVPQYQAIPLISPAEAQQVGPNSLGLVLGWGITDPNIFVRPSALQQASIPIVSDDQCVSRLGLDFDPTSMLCAGVLSGTNNTIDGLDACFGDSGGPLMVQTSGGWKLLGIVSWGYTCASDKFWGVYTRVATFFQWASSARTVRPYNIAAPVISGVPRVGEKLRCLPGIYGGDALESSIVEWKDNDTNQTLLKKSDYVIRAKDIGRAINCEITLSNSGGSLTVNSDPVGPIFPRKASLKLRTGRSVLVREAGVYCSAKKCAIVLSFRRNVTRVRALLVSGSKCLGVRCGVTDTWKDATRLSQMSWTIPLKPGNQKFSKLFIRATDPVQRQSIGFAFDL